MDVLLTDPLFGDLLFAQGIAMTGTPNLQCAAYFGYGKQGVFYNACALPESDDKEDAVCPAAVILAAAMALRHSMGLEWEARCIEKAVAKVLSLGRTADLHQPSLPTVSSSVFTAYIAQTAANIYHHLPNKALSPYRQNVGGAYGIFHPKVKRCGKSVLCPHRREAARVVFFTVFLPFLLLLLWGIFLYHSPRFFSVKLMGQTVFVSVFAVGTAAAAIFFLFFYLPLWLGAKYWYLEICRPGKLRVPSVFYYFSSFLPLRQGGFYRISTRFLPGCSYSAGTAAIRHCRSCLSCHLSPIHQ